MMKVRNQGTFVVNIGGAKVIAPLSVVDVDENMPGVAKLIERGVHVPASDESLSPAPPVVDAPVPETVADLKAALDGLGVEYPDTARKADLQALYAEATAAKG